MRASGVLPGLLRSRLTAGGVFVAGAGVALWRIRSFRDSYRDSWAPMQLATDYLGGIARDGLYQSVFFERGIKFQYPPSSLIYTDVLRQVGVDSQVRLNFVNALLLIGGALVLAALAAWLFKEPRYRAYRWTAAASIWLTSLLYFPNVISFRAGQIQVFLNLLFFLSCLALALGAARSAGVLTGIATAVKPQLAPFFLLALLRREFGFAQGMLACIAVVGGVSLGLYGWANHLEYLEVLRYLSRHGESYYWNTSVNGIAHRLLGNGSASGVVYTEGIGHSAFPPFHPVVYLASTVATLCFTAIPFVAAWRIRRKPGDTIVQLLVFTLAATCFVMASPIAWILHYAVILPCYLVVIRSALDRGAVGGGLPGGSLALVGLSFALTCFEPPLWEAFLTGPSSLLIVPTFYGGLLLSGLAFRELILRTNRAPGALSRTHGS